MASNKCTQHLETGEASFSFLFGLKSLLRFLGLVLDPMQTEISDEILQYL